MKLEFKFEDPHVDWNPLLVFKNYYNWFKKVNTEHEIFFNKTESIERKNPSGSSSPHVMTIKNIENGKYIIVSYWDRAIELTWKANGWNVENMVELITSSGVHVNMDFIPFSYVCYLYEFQKDAENKKVDFEKKTIDRLLFRGHLYGDRKEMSLYKPEYFSDFKKSNDEYFDELNNSKICLSLDGAGEICNRDMEILSVGSVLLRPKLNQKFYNELIPNYHYISVDKVNNPKKQIDLMIDKYEEIKNDNEFLKFISNNGNQWFKKNGTMESNVEILKKIININKLN
jgi:hypothetical protein